jgi:hypothetical protein
MDFQSLVGQTFHENQIYGLLQFEVEENFDSYIGKFLMMYYEPLPEGNLKIAEFVISEGREDYFKAKRKYHGKRAWLEIYDNHGHIDLHLCRQDTSGKMSIVRKTHTYAQEVNGRWFADEDVDPNAPPMTPDQIRQGFRELMGIFDTHEQMNKSRTKIPV